MGRHSGSEISNLRFEIPNCKLQIAILLLLSVFLGAGDSLSERRRRLEGMSAARREDLFHDREQFQALSPEEQQRIRQLHEQLDADPEGEQLRQIMHRYCRWLATLPSYRRAELLELGPEDRIEQIKQLKEEAKQERLKNLTRLLSNSDHEALVSWIDHTYSVAHEEKILDLLPGQRRQQYAKNAALRHRVALWLLCQRWSLRPPALDPPPTEEELAELRQSLSPEVRGKLEPKPQAEQLHMIAAWLPRVPRQQYDLVADFFECVLSDEERDPLLSLPGDAMQKQLREKYMKCVSQLHLPEAPRKPPAKKRPPSAAEKTHHKKTDKDAKSEKTKKSV